MPGVEPGTAAGERYGQTANHRTSPPRNRFRCYRQAAGAGGRGSEQMLPAEQGPVSPAGNRARRPAGPDRVEAADRDGSRTRGESDATGGVGFTERSSIRVDSSLFGDANGDGFGDLAGIRQKLHYIRSLGATVPTTRSYLTVMMAGDISDHLQPDPRFGTIVDVIGS